MTVNKYQARGRWLKLDTLEVLQSCTPEDLKRERSNLVFFASRFEAEVYLSLRRYFSRSAIKIHHKVPLFAYSKYPLKLSWNIDFWVEENGRTELVIEAKGLVLDSLKYQLALFSAAHPIEWERKFFLVFPRTPYKRTNLVQGLIKQSKILSMSEFDRMLHKKYGNDAF